MHKTGLAFDARCLLHTGPPSAYENPKNLAAVIANLKREQLFDRCLRILIRPVSLEEVCTTHSLDHYHSLHENSQRAHLQATQHQQRDDDKQEKDFENKRDPFIHVGPWNDTYVCGHTANAALLAAGGAVSVVKAILEGKIHNGISAMRPPGHHASCSRVEGFCHLNNAAIAANVALNSGKAQRVLIVDWDVHHGNGTQALFYNNPQVLYFSIHRFGKGFYPGTGTVEEVGCGAGVGTTVNLPIPAGMGDDEYVMAFDRLLVPIANEFAPDLIIVSAGCVTHDIVVLCCVCKHMYAWGSTRTCGKKRFDAAQGDPLGGMSVTPQGFARLTAKLMYDIYDSRNHNAPVVSLLEGGYHPGDVAACFVAMTRVLLQDRFVQPLKTGPLTPLEKVALNFPLPATVGLSPGRSPRPKTPTTKSPLSSLARTPLTRLSVNFQKPTPVSSLAFLAQHMSSPLPFHSPSPLRTPRSHALSASKPKKISGLFERLVVSSASLASLSPRNSKSSNKENFVISSPPANQRASPFRIDSSLPSSPTLACQHCYHISPPPPLPPSPPSPPSLSSSDFPRARPSRTRKLPMKFRLPPSDHVSATVLPKAKEKRQQRKTAMNIQLQLQQLKEQFEQQQQQQHSPGSLKHAQHSSPSTSSASPFPIHVRKKFHTSSPSAFSSSLSSAASLTSPSRLSLSSPSSFVVVSPHASSASSIGLSDHSPVAALLSASSLSSFAEPQKTGKFKKPQPKISAVEASVGAEKPVSTSAFQNQFSDNLSRNSSETQQQVERQQRLAAVRIARTQQLLLAQQVRAQKRSARLRTVNLPKFHAALDKVVAIHATYWSCLRSQASSLRTAGPECRILF